MAEIVAVADKVIVEIKPKDNISDGGIIMPDTAQSILPQNSGEVISVGPLCEKIEKGDVCLFHERGGMDLILDKVVLKVLKFDEVYAVIKPDATDELEEVLEESDAGE